MAVLLIDAANVVGARPDGWWRDRPAAATRLLARLDALAGRELTAPDLGPFRCEAVVAVVEGQALSASAPGGIEVVRAAGSGDDALVARAAELVADGRTVLAVTADRHLRERLPTGVAVAGPGWLLACLDAVEPA